MAFERVKRNRYQHPQGAIFTHGSEHHFQDHEEFHRPLLRVDSAALRGDWGIAAGLEVSGTPGASAVVIDSGAAVDKPGETIVLSAGGFGDVGANPPGNQHDEKPVPVSLPLASHSGQTVYVTIQFNEISRSNEGSGGRFEQVPWIRLQPTAGTGAYVDDGLSIILAIAVISGTGTLSDLRAQDGVLPFGRRLLGRRTGPVRLKRRQKAGDKLSEVAAGTIAGLDGGGLRLSVPNTSDVVRIEQDGGGSFANLDLHANDILARNAAGQVTVELDSAAARVTAGTTGVDGDIEVHNASGASAIHLEGATPTIHIRDSGGREVLNFDGRRAWLRIGTEGNGGDIEVQDGSGRTVLRIDGNLAQLSVGTAARSGEIALRDSAGNTAARMSASAAELVLGTTANGGDIWLRNSAGQVTIHLDGDTGLLTSNNNVIAGNPVRLVNSRWLFANNNTDTEVVDLGSTRRLFAFVAMTGCNPQASFDRSDALALDVFRVDGVLTSTFIFNGDHWGPEGSISNIRAQSFSGSGRRITFRARSFEDASVYGIGVVFFE